MTFATALCFEHCALSMYFKANSFFDLLCSTTRTYIHIVTRLVNPLRTLKSNAARERKQPTLRKEQRRTIKDHSRTLPGASASCSRIQMGGKAKRLGDVLTFPKAPFPTTR